MIEIAEHLSNGFDYLRVDLYIIDLSFASSKRLILAGRYHIYGQVRQTG